MLVRVPVRTWQGETRAHPDNLVSFLHQQHMQKGSPSEYGTHHLHQQQHQLRISRGGKASPSQPRPRAALLWVRTGDWSSCTHCSASFLSSVDAYSSSSESVFLCSSSSDRPPPCTASGAAPGPAPAAGWGRLRRVTQSICKKAKQSSAHADAAAGWGRLRRATQSICTKAKPSSAHADAAADWGQERSGARRPRVRTSAPNHIPAQAHASPCKHPHPHPNTPTSTTHTQARRAPCVRLVRARSTLRAIGSGLRTCHPHLAAPCPGPGMGCQSPMSALRVPLALASLRSGGNKLLLQPSASERSGGMSGTSPAMPGPASTRPHAHTGTHIEVSASERPWRCRRHGLARGANNGWRAGRSCAPLNSNRIMRLRLRPRS